MTREEMKDVLPILQAWTEGKTIQCNVDDIWIDADINLELSLCDISKYRIKPEPKYRPFNSKEECWQEMQKHQPFGWVKKKGHYVNITRVSENCSYDGYFKIFTFADGTPFGIKEE